MKYACLCGVCIYMYYHSLFSFLQACMCDRIQLKRWLLHCILKRPYKHYLIVVAALSRISVVFVEREYCFFLVSLSFCLFSLYVDVCYPLLDVPFTSFHHLPHFNVGVFSYFSLLSKM